MALENHKVQHLLLSTPPTPTGPDEFEKWVRDQDVALEILVLHTSPDILDAICTKGFTDESTPAETYVMIKSEVAQHPEESRAEVATAISTTEVATAISTINIADFSSPTAFLLRLDYLWKKLADGMSGPISDDLYVNYLLVAIKRGRSDWYQALVMDPSRQGWPTKKQLISFINRQATRETDHDGPGPLLAVSDGKDKQKSTDRGQDDPWATNGTDKLVTLREHETSVSASSDSTTLRAQSDSDPPSPRQPPAYGVDGAPPQYEEDLEAEGKRKAMVRRTLLVRLLTSVFITVLVALIVAAVMGKIHDRRESGNKQESSDKQKSDVAG